MKYIIHLLINKLVIATEHFNVYYMRKLDDNRWQ